LNIAIRADASIAIGTGHIIRCLNLADDTRRRGSNVRFICRKQPGNLVERIEQSGFEVTEIAASGEAEDASQVIDTLGGQRPDWLVVDHYGLGREWETALRPFVGRIFVIDDIARTHECDILLDQNWIGKDAADRYSTLVPRQCERLIGPKYSLLGSEFAAIRKKLRPRDGKNQRILVFFGGVDETNETGKVLEALSSAEFSALVVDIVIGKDHPSSNEILTTAALLPNTVVHQDLPSLANLMHQADSAVGAAGGAMWERLCLDLPSTVVAVAENQIPSARALSAAGYIRWLGIAPHIQVNDYATAIAQPPPPLSRLPPLVDGLGTSRCVDRMLDR
jgi:UDP-2,4-diacetamido-2,4,6-trideoxy-beta-L-altropyranose hydrolase